MLPDLWIFIFVEVIHHIASGNQNCEREGSVKASLSYFISDPITVNTVLQTFREERMWAGRVWVRETEQEKCLS